MEAKNKIDKHIEDYSKFKDKYSRFAKSIAHLLEQLLDSSGIKFQHVAFRGKGIDKLKEKYIRQPELIDKPLEEIYDLAGSRVIFYLEEQIVLFVEVLKREFEIIDLKIRQDPTGYNAAHIIIKLNDRRSKLVEYSEFSDLICEIQLTTVLFHAWSEINHDIIYKNDAETKKFSEKDMGFIEEKLKEIMHNYIQKASYNLSFVVKQHERLKKGMQILNTDTMASLAESNSNKEILNYILTLDNFSEIYRLPKEFNFLNILDKLLVKALGNDSAGGLKIIEASFDFLKNIVYWDYRDIIKFCMDRIDKTEYRKSCEKVLLEISKYNLNVVKIREIGYKPQAMLLEEIMSLKSKELFNEFLIEVCKHLLTTSIEGNSQDEFNTFTFTQGPIFIDDILKKIRNETIKLLFSLMDKSNCKQDTLIIKTLFSSIKIHYPTIRKEDLDILRVNAKSILSEIKSGYASLENGVKREIEMKLKYSSKPIFEGVEEVNQLIELISKDRGYQKYRSFIGYETDYGPDWKTVEKDRKELLDKFVDTMSDSKVDNWIGYIKNILRDYDTKDYGLFQNLHYFLNELGKKKPKLGAKFKSIPEIQSFQVALLCGLLKSNEKTKHYDEIKEWIAKSERLLDIAVTFRFFSDYDEKTFSNLVSNSLKKGDINQLVELLITICKNYKIKKSTVEQFMQIIQKFTEKKYFDWPQRISFIIDDILSDLSIADYEIISINLINQANIEYYTEKILMPLAEKHPEKVIDFFYERVKLSKSGTDPIDSIPFNFELIQKPLSQQMGIIVPKILEWLKKDGWRYKWEAGNLLNMIFPKIDDKLKEVFTIIIKEKKLDRLNQIFWILDKYEGTADVLRIVYEIVKNFEVTNKIRNRLFSMLSNIGVVTGEYGIVEAYKTKIKNIEPWLSDAESKVVEFAKGYKTYLENIIKYETARVDKELDLMRSEFDRKKRI